MYHFCKASNVHPDIKKFTTSQHQLLELIHTFECHTLEQGKNGSEKEGDASSKILNPTLIVGFESVRFSRTGGTSVVVRFESACFLKIAGTSLIVGFQSVCCREIMLPPVVHLNL